MKDLIRLKDAVHALTVWKVYFVVIIVSKSSSTWQYIGVFRAIIPKTNSKNLTYLKQSQDDDYGQIIIKCVSHSEINYSELG